MDFPKHVLSKPLHVEDFQKYMDDCERILSSFFRDSGISWWDVYSRPDIKKERLEIAKEMKLKKSDSMLDVGCGRGYFSIAASTLSRSVVGVDLMNDYGRQGWWRNFRESMQEMGLHNAAGFIGGSCKLCPECVARSNSREPCRHSFNARPSMEAVGIDVFETAKNAGLPFNIPPKNNKSGMDLY